MLMKKLKHPSRLMIVLLALTLVFVAGCQAIGGVDLNAVLKNTLKVTSSESKQTVELALQLDEELIAELPEEETALFKLISNVKLQLDNVKVENNTNASFDGTLTLGGIAPIGFSLQMNEKSAVLEIEGAKQPFALDMTGATIAEMAGVLPEDIASAANDESMSELGHSLIDIIGDYAIDNLPNPDKIEVKPVTETINGESVALMQVHTELDGKAIWAWVKKYVDTLVADREGLDLMVKGLMEALSNHPDIWETLETVNPFEESGELDAPTTDELIEQAADELAAMLEQLQADLKEMESDDPESIEMLLGDNLQVKADMYVDSKLDIRKQAFELSYTIPQDEEEELVLFPFKGITVKFSSEHWNVNGEVAAKEPVVTDSALSLEEMWDISDYELMKLFKEDSAIYDIMKNKLHLNRQTVTFFADSYYNPPIVVKGSLTLVPLRDTAEELGAFISYDPKTKSIELFDEATNTTIELKVGSDNVVINGQSVKWPFPVTNVDGVTYVPARSLSSALKAKIGWEELYGVNALTIEREV